MRSILHVTAVAVMLFSFSLTATAQVQTARYVSIVSNSGGFYEYLPQGYSSGSQNYPLIIFVHGAGQNGNGTTNLPLVLQAGLPQYINQGQFPNSFNVGGSNYSFIVISPQFKAWPVVSDIQAIINYAVQNYRVDQNRIYLTGMSMGGAITWEYAGSSSTVANKIAAIVPVCGALYPTVERSTVIANAGLHVWATHNNNDPTVPVSYTNDYIRYITAAAPNTPNLAKKTIFTSNTHDAWTATYNPAGVPGESGNIYEWMLQFRRGQIVLPVQLSSYTVKAVGSSKVVAEWTTAQEQNNDYFSVERSADGITFTKIGQVRATNNANGGSYQYTDENPLTGISYYRLSQTDFNGKTELFDTKTITIANTYTGRLELFPNPARENINLRLNDAYAGKLQVRITSNAGQVMKTMDLTKADGLLQQNIPVTGIPAGNYLLEVKGNGVSYSGMFIKQ